MIVISPAKNLKFDEISLGLKCTNPIFKEKTKKLVNALKKLSKLDIQNLMKISDNLAKQNFERYENFNLNEDSQNVQYACFAFNGGTYQGLGIRSFDTKELLYSQKKLRILSGLYGLLKPLDKIQPYRLEMGTNITNFFGSSLYEYWSNDLTNALNNDMKKNHSKILFNLSSVEYFNSVDKKKLDFPFITPFFYNKKNNKLVSVGMISKKCRGAMARFILLNKIDEVEKIKNFAEDGYRYENHDINKNSIFFVKS